VLCSLCTHTPRSAGRPAFHLAGVSEPPRQASLSNGEVASTCRTTCTDECQQAKPTASMQHVRRNTKMTSSQELPCNNPVRTVQPAIPRSPASTYASHRRPRVRNGGQSRGDFPRAPGERGRAGHRPFTMSCGFIRSFRVGKSQAHFVFSRHRIWCHHRLAPTRSPVGRPPTICETRCAGWAGISTCSLS